ncbi:MAG: GMC family oxidoreductase N-terminal domain-containing protein [Gammaproteobacteria bacterium]|nr:GMC family oxidoreductase N-terminal domain-containing protein [Gammaproteobacteria bacterium]
MVDVIVVGGGSAGCAMAARLAESGQLRVVLLEAGRSDDKLISKVPALMSGMVQNPEFDWRLPTEPDPSIGGRADIWPAARRLGGGSAINGMMFVRGHAWDYDQWAAAGARGWSHAEVLPFFRRMETNERGADAWRGGEGPQAASEVRARWPITDAWIAAAQQAGIARSRDLNGEIAEGVDHAQASQKNGLRHSTASAYLRGPRRPRGLTIELEAHATRLIIQNGRAVGVEYRRGDAVHTLRAERGVVLCAGSLNTPRLLLLSGIGPGAELTALGLAVASDLPGVGRNLQEHVGTHIIHEVNTATMNSAVRGLGGLVQLMQFVLRRRGALTTPIGHAQAFVKSRPDLPVPNLQIAFAPFAFDIDARSRLVLRKQASISQAIFLVRPKARGSLTLRSPDPQDAPLIRHQLYADEDDVRQVAEGIEIARRIVRQEALARFITGEARPGPEASGEALHAYCRMAAIPGFHPVGTCRMGEDANAVVDPDLAVRGIAGLWVADGSIFPRITAGNTNATCIMIGDKGAAHVLKSLKLRSTVSA